MRVISLSLCSRLQEGKKAQGRDAAGSHPKRDKRARPGTTMAPLKETERLQSHRFKLRHFSLPWENSKMFSKSHEIRNWTS